MTLRASASIAMLMMITTTTAFAAEIVTQTRQGGAVVAQTHTFANAAGDLRIDERGPRARAASASAAGGAGSSANPPPFEAGELLETTIFQQREQAIVSLEGSICRKLSVADRPAAAPRAEPRRKRGRFAEAMGKAGAAIEEAMEQARRDGEMTEEQARAMREFMGGRGLSEPLSYEVRATGETVDVNGYRGEGYEVVDSRGTVAQRLWMTPTKRLKGARDVRDAMEGMMAAYREFLDQMGGGAVMDTSMIAVFESDELAGKYPVRIEDFESGEVTDVVDVRSADADYYPDCEERSMFGM